MSAEQPIPVRTKTLTLTLDFDPERVTDDALRSALEWALYRLTVERDLVNDTQLAWRWNPAPVPLRFHCTC